MKILNISVYIVLFIGCFKNLNAQKSNQIWSHKIFDYTITINLEHELFKVDTIDSYEGYVFYFKLLNDSSYFRLNYITPNAKFECCNEKVIYNEINRTSINGVFDRNGNIKLSNLYWREIRNRDIEVVYNNCNNEKLKLFNRIMDSILKCMQTKN
jgi:hypothetical protein